MGRYAQLLRGARLKVSQASIEDINYKANRGLDKRQIARWPPASGSAVRRIYSSRVLLARARRGSLALSRSNAGFPR